MIPAIIYIAAYLFAGGCSLGMDRDPRPWDAPRIGYTVASFVALGAAICLLVNAL